MFKLSFEFVKKFFNSAIQKGQSMAFFAIMIPWFFLFFAMAVDFGWMYFNQSRLQNAADAAAIAGARELVFDEKNLSDYTYTTLVSVYDEGLQKLVRNNTISKRSTSDGDQKAKLYLKFNLEGKGNDPFEIVDISPVAGGKTLRDNYDARWNRVKFSHMLYGSDADDFQALYYVITISEQLDHLFGDIIEYFNGMFPFNIPHLESRAIAVVKITHVMIKIDPDNPLHGPSLYQQMKELRDRENYADWWEIKYEYDRQPNTTRQEMFNTTDTMTIARSRSVQAKGNGYVDGDVYRTETLTLHGWSIATSGNGNTSGNKMNQMNLDNLFIDLKADRNSPKKDIDDGSTGTTNYNLTNTGSAKESKITDDSTFSNGITGKDVLKYRIHDLINVGKWTGTKYEYVYKVRENKEPPDPLYVHIESEDNYVDSGSGNTVRQMIINVNATNKNEQTDRPMFFFYEGPQKYYTTKGKESKSQTKWKEDWRETWKYLGYYSENNYDDTYLDNPRNSMPVIFNLFADFRGVLFMPNSPVVINGHNHIFEGFIVAERFLRLKTADDFPDIAKHSNAISDGYTYRKDDRGNEYYYNGAYYLVHYNKAAEYYYNGEKESHKFTKIAHLTGSDGKPLKVKGKNAIEKLDVIYATGPFEEYSGDPLTDSKTIKASDNIFETTVNTSTGNVTKYYKIDGSYVEIDDKTYIKVKPNAATYIKSNNKYVKITSGEYELYDENFQLKTDEEGNTLTDNLLNKDIKIQPTDRFVHYTYRLITKEKTNLLSTFSSYEKEYVPVSPMYVDQFGNVQYANLSSSSVYSERPNPLDSEWHKGDVYEVIYNPDTFNLSAVRYNSYNKVRLRDYTNLNDTTRYVGTQPLSDVFFTTIRSDWID